MSDALARMTARIDVIERAVGDRYPLYADPVDDRWTTTRRGSWTGGFWTGLLWLRATLSGTDGDRETARSWARRLPARAADDTDTRAMTFWYGAGVGRRWLDDSDAADVARAGAEAVAAAVLPGPGFVPVGSAFGGDPGQVGVDSLAAVIALLDDAGRPDLARTHARAVVDRLLESDGTVGPAAHGAVWARGQAWGVLGLAVAADRLGEEFAEPAARLADRWLALAGTGVPPAMLGSRDAPLDTSAAVIAAAGLWTLGESSTAGRIVDAVVGGHLRPDGTLTDGCYDLPGRVGCAHELIWGTFFLATLLAVRDRRVPAPGW